MNKKTLGSVFLISILIMGFSSNPLAFQKSDVHTKSVSGYLNIFHTNFSVMAFAESDNESKKQTDEQNAGNNSDNVSNTSVGSEGEINLDNNTVSAGVEGENNQNNNNTSVGSEGEINLDNNTVSAGVDGENNHNNNNTSVDSEGEIENENNNEKAMHEQTQQDANNIDDAKKNDTIAAEVDINNENVGTQSIDNNVSVKTEHPTSDTVSITVNASSQTGPKVLLINLNSTTIDVANMKYIDVLYDGNHIAPAANVDEVLHPASSDQPHYAILVTQSGAQILVSIPHFSPHTITISKIDKVMSTAVPEFPIALLVMLVAVTLAVTFYRIKPIKI